MTRPPTDLAEGVWQYQTRLWETNSLLVEAGGETLLCDPAWTAAEIDAIRRRAARTNGQSHILITHADYDHTCGIGFFPEAAVVTGHRTAEAIASGAATDALNGASAEWGLTWEGDLHVDRVVEAGTTFECGGFHVAAIEARGHVADGLAYAILDQGVLVPGDYLSGMTYPFVTASIADATQTCKRLLSALDEHDLRWVVPGHGRALAPEEAEEIGEADVRYLEELARVAREATVGGLAPSDALIAVYGVNPPRATTHDFEIYGIRAFNAGNALAEAGGAG